MAESQNMARTWMDMPANKLTPTEFCAQAKLLFPNALIRDTEWIREQGMLAFLAVASGSRQPPKFLEVHVEPKTVDSKDQRPVVLVGKGVTFDTGGISIKPSASMDMMRGDMGGAATVLAAAYGASKLSLKRKVIVLIPLTENMPGGNAIKPGDIVTARNGKSIKIDNTDAEGRLILADALSYADSFNPETVIDVATLTGACHIALGAAASAVFTPSDRIFNALQQAGTDAGDRFWRMPLFKHYRNKMKTSSADLCNISKPTAGAGSCTAAAFLSEFTTCDNWVHIDIAGVAGLVAPDDEIPYVKGTMTGRPTRALIKWLLSLK
uniref:Cytosol aminopeptidase domain-containing protein n=1 Tax=Plectus sambesii TaxID=2011161 RepID=A0A914VJW0_9BILA